MNPITAPISGLRPNQYAPASTNGSRPGQRADQEDLAADERVDDTGASAELSKEELEEVRELKARDREVRAHEQAHASAGGAHAGSPRYEYTQGPDGVRYATGGEVSIDVSPVPGDPEATIRKMGQVRAAALAPADPSPADRAVAQEATATAAQARAEQFNQVKSLQDDSAIRALGKGQQLSIAV